MRQLGRAPLPWLAMLLAGCSSLPAVAPDALPAASSPAARAATLGLAQGDCSAPHWGMAGRVALSNGRDGGSGRITWSQGGGALHLEMSAPLTRQSWRLDVDAEGAVLRGISPDAQRGDDAARLLRDATGWDVPVQAMGCWLRAVEADPARFGPAQIERGVDGLPKHLAQAGWSVDYAGWTPDPASGLPMPVRVTASRDANRVRLLVDRWSAE